MQIILLVFAAPFQGFSREGSVGSPESLSSLSSALSKPATARRGPHNGRRRFAERCNHSDSSKLRGLSENLHAIDFQETRWKFWREMINRLSGSFYKEYISLNSSCIKIPSSVKYLRETIATVSLKYSINNCLMEKEFVHKTLFSNGLPG
ncbi:hypothetical protein STEG23_001062 [Scotinomys teguina]